MLYRESAGGRLPELRLAAADARTAEYLSDKVLQLEAGQPLPATLGETELRFHLYYQNRRLDLLFKDYQGEHVAVGRQEPIRDFLRDCDAVWLCLDPALLESPGRNLRGQQEVEQVVEDYLALEKPGGVSRPMALVLTKSDLLSPDPTQPEADWLRGLLERHFAMTVHALKEHSPHHGLFAVSSLGPRPAEGSTTPPTFQPRNLDQPLRWLVDALRAQDEARMEQ